MEAAQKSAPNRRVQLFAFLDFPGTDCRDEVPARLALARIKWPEARPSQI